MNGIPQLFASKLAVAAYVVQRATPHVYLGQCLSRLVPNGVHRFLLSQLQGFRAQRVHYSHCEDKTEAASVDAVSQRQLTHGQTIGLELQSQVRMGYSSSTPDSLIAVVGQVLPTPQALANL